MTRFDDAFGGKNGYFRAYARDKYTPENVLEGLGDVFQSEFISFKTMAVLQGYAYIHRRRAKYYKCT